VNLVCMPCRNVGIIGLMAFSRKHAATVASDIHCATAGLYSDVQGTIALLQ